MKLLAIDPGINCSGWAVFQDNILTQASYSAPSKGDFETRLQHLVRASRRDCMFDHFDRLIIEMPQAYRGDRSVPPEDLIKLGIVAGYWAGYVETGAIEFVLPRTWKGQVPKLVMCHRILSRLQPEEMQRIALPDQLTEHTRATNMVDAIGIGLWALGRL